MSASTDKILFLLKTQGPLTAKAIGEDLGMTSMGARQHLQQLTDAGWVSFYDEAKGRGRPSRYWQLTEKAVERFPNTHADLTLQLIDNVTTLFGQEGLNQVIATRQQKIESQYQIKLAPLTSLADKLIALTELRCDEGYMASWHLQDDGSYLFVENHCPICAAATHCQGFCESELVMFSQLLAPAKVLREQHLLAGGDRCTYRIVSP